MGRSPVGGSGRSGQVRLNLRASGHGTLQMPRGIICKSCPIPRIFATHDEWHAHRKFGPGGCTAKVSQILQDEVPVRVEMEYRPFARASDLMRSLGLRAEMDGVLILAAWADGNGAGDWSEMFAPGREEELKRKLFLAECEIIKGLQELAASLTVSCWNPDRQGSGR